MHRTQNMHGSYCGSNNGPNKQPCQIKNEVLEEIYQFCWNTESTPEWLLGLKAWTTIYLQQKSGWMPQHFPPRGTEELTPAAPSQTWRSWGCGPGHGERWGCRPTGPSLPEDPLSALWGWKHLRIPQSGSPHESGSEGQRQCVAQLHGEKSHLRMLTLTIRTARKT